MLNIILLTLIRSHRSLKRPPPRSSASPLIHENGYIFTQDEHYICYGCMCANCEKWFLLFVPVSPTRRGWDCGSSDTSRPCCCLGSGSSLPESPLQPPSSTPTVIRRYPLFFFFFFFFIIIFASKLLKIYIYSAVYIFYLQN